MKRIFVLFYIAVSAPVFLTAQKTKTATVKPVLFNAADRPKNLSDTALLELVQKQTFRYFWDFGHPVSGMARERSNGNYDYGDEVVTTGGTGFGIMAMIVAADRKWQPRDSISARLLKMVNFLFKAQAYHGVFPHWMDGATGKTIPFGRRDDGADLVETPFLFQGLLCARQYFGADNDVERELRQRITWLWEETNWNWHTRDNSDQLYWHWSPNYSWDMNFALRGWNETLITYILAASAPRYPISAEVYHKCWAESSHFKNGKEFYGVKLPLGFDYGGPLFFTHYSFLGLNSHDLKDEYANYWEQNYNHTLINYKHCVLNPNHFKGYGENCWGLTAGDTYDGYNAYSPDNDGGTIAPTAALSAFPYTPEYSMKALKHFYYDLGDKIWSEYGFVDGFNETKNWYANSHLAIDQGPVIVMIENYRTGLLWKLFMSVPEIQNGLNKLGFESPMINK
ncbi:MAG TPA: glucoamylase family protein [Panacibacter sp.]|nr:glucoamylase family protein [Panacibacter sp.]